MRVFVSVVSVANLGDASASYHVFSLKDTRADTGKYSTSVSILVMSLSLKNNQWVVTKCFNPFSLRRVANPGRSIEVWLSMWSSALFRGEVSLNPGATTDGSIRALRVAGPCPVPVSTILE
jgi:hypothetical protein